MGDKVQGAPASPSGSRPSGEAPAGLHGSATLIPSAGEVFTIVYPFVRDTYTDWDEEGSFEAATWKPGIRMEEVGYGEAGGDVAEVADAIGSAIFTVVDTFKPGRFPMRVFFTRQFVNPDGKQFGKSKLHIATLDKFRRLTRGYQHPFGIGEPLPSGGTWNRTRQWEQFREMLAAHAQAIEARRAETANAGSVEDESAVPQACAQSLHHRCLMTEPTGKLAACPFCGGEASVIGIRDGRQVSCKGQPHTRCYAKGPAAYHGPEGWEACEAEAIERWNTRAQSADDTLIGELVGALEGLLALVNRNDVASWLACEHPAEFCNAEDAVSDAQRVLQSAKQRGQK